MKNKTSDVGRSKKTTKPTSRPNRRVQHGDIDVPYYGRPVNPTRTDLRFLHEDMAALALGLEGRNEAVFFHQVLFSLLALTAKISTRDPNDPDGATEKQKIGQMFENLIATYPRLPKRRCLDNWCEGTVGGLIFLELLPFPLPQNAEKMPRLTDIKQLSHLTYGHVEKLVTEFRSMARLLRFIRSLRGTAKPPIDLLDRVLRFLGSDKPLSDEERKKLDLVIQAAKKHLAADGGAATNGKAEFLASTAPEGNGNSSAISIPPEEKTLLPAAQSARLGNTN